MLDRREFLAGTLTGASAAGILGGIVAVRSRRGPAKDEAAEGRVSYAQMGEDLVVSDLLRNAMGIDRPTYVDIGAADPVANNNTYLLYTKGSHGVLVEPNPFYQERLRLRRPNDRVVHAGVGVADATEADYYVIRDAPMRNTFSKDDVEDLRRRRGHDVVERVMRLPLISINRLIADYLGRAPDLLSVDVEGLDYAILQTLDFVRYRPALVIAETAPEGPIPALLMARGYQMRGASLNNAIFADPARYRGRDSTRRLQF